jgi:hypothetical protein
LTPFVNLDTGCEIFFNGPSGSADKNTSVWSNDKKNKEKLFSEYIGKLRDVIDWSTDIIFGIQDIIDIRILMKNLS